MLEKITKIEDLNKLKYLFKDIRFYRGKSTLQGLMGEAYVDTIENYQFAILLLRKSCFMSGNINAKKLYKLINNNLKQCIIIPSDNLKSIIEDLFKGNIKKLQRYSMKKNTTFDEKKLQTYINMLPNIYEMKRIDGNIERRIKEEAFLKITDDYKNNGIGYCCLYNNEIIGVASSNIFYKDGIEVNIRVKERYQRKGIATALSSKLILQCLKEDKTISWDAANLKSKCLAEKLGFIYDSTYDIYKFE